MTGDKKKTLLKLVTTVPAHHFTTEGRNIKSTMTAVKQWNKIFHEADLVSVEAV